MQELTLIFHIVSIGVAIWIYIFRGTWRYFAVMLGLFNFVGISFYAGVLYNPGFSGHFHSQLRSLLQVVMWLVFAGSLVLNNKGNNG